MSQPRRQNRLRNSPTNWVRFSDKKMNKAECEKMLSGRTEAGKSREEKVT
ncbi:hypothetical protein DOH12_24155, partial [Salmonella enterica subsp. enterica]|nr:hypothetical protein [Salmonella enterica subsp. enterica serovar Sandiego]EEE4267027.1 DUF1187 family protein [Salmonella enterica subsp. enterica serovar Sandiego]